MRDGKDAGQNLGEGGEAAPVEGWHFEVPKLEDLSNPEILIATIRDFLAKSGMTPNRFGLAAMNDGAFVPGLIRSQNHRRPRPETLARLFSFFVQYRPGAAPKIDRPRAPRYTKEQMLYLAARWIEKASGKEIAEEMNERFGTRHTPNSILIKAGRMHLPPRQEGRIPSAPSPGRVLRSPRSSTALPRPIAAERTCLGECGKPFASEHAGDRFCPKCRNNDSFRELLRFADTEYSIP